MEIVSQSSWTYLDRHFLNLLQTNKNQKSLQILSYLCSYMHSMSSMRNAASLAQFEGSNTELQT